MIKHVIFDLDGVLYRDQELTPSAIEATEALRVAGGKLAFLTNNSARHRQEVAAHLRQMGFRASHDEVVTSGYAAALHITRRHARKPVFVIGAEGLAEELAEQGIPLVTDAEQAGVVVVGWDRELTFAKLSTAHQAIMDGAAFVATNEDRSFPLSGGKTCPGAGAIVAALMTSTGRQPERVGKPLPRGLQMIAEGWKVPPHQVAVVGDRLETDVAAARTFGARSVLVLTGVTSRQQAMRARGDEAPDIIIEDLSSLMEALQ